MPQITVQGLSKLSRELRAIGKDLPKELKTASSDSADLVAAEAAQLAPRLTGRLAASVKAGPASATGSSVTLSGLPYIKSIVYGRRSHNIEPNPFPFTAVDERRQAVIDRFSETIEKLVARNITPGTGGV